MKEKKVSFIGCGNMGVAILNGLLDDSLLGPGELGFFEKDPSRRDMVSSKYNVEPFEDISSTVKNSEYLLIAVKPQDISGLMRSLRDHFDKDRNCIISIAAGISTVFYEESLGGDAPIIRVMPNTPALYRKGMITISAGKFTARKQMEFVLRIMGSVGSCIVIDEGLQHISTAINGSGPAYFFLFCKALVDTAVKNGMDSRTARKLAAATMAGSGEMLERSGMDIEELISRVASPGGTTEKALKVFREKGLEKMISLAVEDALNRSMELEREMT